MHKFLPFVFLLILFSCQDAKKQEQLTQVEKLIQKTDSIKTVFAEQRNDSIMTYITIIMDVEFRIRRSYKADTVPEDFARKINRYKQVRKRIKPITKMNQQIQTGSEEELSALNKLKTDIENGVGDRDKYDEYIAFESKKVEQLNTVLNEIISVQNKQLGIFNSLHKELYDFSMTLEHVIK